MPYFNARPSEHWPEETAIVWSEKPLGEAREEIELGNFYSPEIAERVAELLMRHGLEAKPNPPPSQN